MSNHTPMQTEGPALPKRLRGEVMEAMTDTVYVTVKASDLPKLMERLRTGAPLPPPVVLTTWNEAMCLVGYKVWRSTVTDSKDSECSAPETVAAAGSETTNPLVHTGAPEAVHPTCSDGSSSEQSASLSEETGAVPRPESPLPTKAPCSGSPSDSSGESEVKPIAHQGKDDGKVSPLCSPVVMGSIKPPNAGGAA